MFKMLIRNTFEVKYILFNVIDSLVAYFILVTYFMGYYHRGVEHFDDLYVNMKLRKKK